MLKVSDVTATADQNGEFTNGVVAQGLAPTIIDAQWLNAVQRELVNAVEGSGQVLDKTDFSQLAQALQVASVKRYPFNQAFSTAIGGYPKGSIILGRDGVTLWQSTIDSNTTDPDSAGTKGWSTKTKVIFRFDKKGDQTVGLATPTQIKGFSSIVDTNNGFSNDEYIVPVDGVYLLQIGFSSNWTGSNKKHEYGVSAVIYKNSVNIAWVSTNNSATPDGRICFQGSQIIQLKKGDALTLKVISYVADSISVADGNGTFFSGFLI